MRDILGVLPTIGEPLPSQIPTARIMDYVAPITSAMTPIISAYWDEAGKTVRAKIGLDPDDWRVVDPHLHEKIVTQSHNLCESALATTTDTVDVAYAKLKNELVTGIVEQGEAIPELRKRVKTVFTELSTDHAEMIARTEASRAVHEAAEESAKESEVVTGKKILLSASACPFCHEIAAKWGDQPVPLGGEFANRGNNPTYSSLKMPPFHPNCRCSVTLVLTQEYEDLLAQYGPPEPTFEEGPLGPEPKERHVPALEELAEISGTRPET